MYYRWDQSDVDLLINKYINENLPIREIHKKYLPHFSPRQIVKKLLRMKVVRDINPDSWTNDEIRIIKDNYSTIENLDDLLILLPKRTMKSISRKAYLMDIKRDNKIRRRNTYKNNLKRLLEESLESFYWLGFIFADGSVDKCGELALELSVKDEKHVQKFASFLGFDNCVLYKRRNNVSFSKCDKNTIDALFEKYQLKPNKTYNPPTFKDVFKNMTPNQVLSLIIGFIDGDGHIRKTKNTYNITLENHVSWMRCYKDIKDFIKNEMNLTFKNNLIRINNRGYVVMCFSQNNIFLKMKEFIHENKLPVLERKWNL